MKMSQELVTMLPCKRRRLLKVSKAPVPFTKDTIPFIQDEECTNHGEGQEQLPSSKEETDTSTKACITDRKSFHFNKWRPIDYENLKKRSYLHEYEARAKQWCDASTRKEFVEKIHEFEMNSINTQGKILSESSNKDLRNQDRVGITSQRRSRRLENNPQIYKRFFEDEDDSFQHEDESPHSLKCTERIASRNPRRANMPAVTSIGHCAHTVQSVSSVSFSSDAKEVESSAATSTIAEMPVSIFDYDEKDGLSYKLNTKLIKGHQEKEAYYNEHQLHDSAKKALQSCTTDEVSRPPTVYYQEKLRSNIFSHLQDDENSEKIFNFDNEFFQGTDIAESIPTSDSFEEIISTLLPNQAVRTITEDDIHLPSIQDEDYTNDDELQEQLPRSKEKTDASTKVYITNRESLYSQEWSSLIHDNLKKRSHLYEHEAKAKQCCDISTRKEFVEERFFGTKKCDNKLAEVPFEKDIYSISPLTLPATFISDESFSSDSLLLEDAKVPLLQSLSFDICYEDSETS